MQNILAQLNEADNTVILLLGIGVIVLFIVAAILLIVLLKKNKVIKDIKNNANSSVEKVKVVDGKRVSTDPTQVGTTEKPDATHAKDDILLRANEVYRIRKDSLIKPGIYTILTTDSNANTFYIRVNGLSRRHKHLSQVVFEAGDEISPVAINIILR
ncbi:MAG: hypothetical protein LBR37_03675 [Erysipelotrichaceae bacterium]|jgi:hypothetical protein|nr:hypothetical protein [Erysipelotrichaceae bacterium]